jgi:hypothetical protein
LKSILENPEALGNDAWTRFWAEKYPDWNLTDLIRQAGQLIESGGFVGDFLESIIDGHDNKNVALASVIQLSFLASKGEKYVRAWFLHHILDRVKDGYMSEFPPEEYFVRLSNTNVFFEHTICNVVKEFIKEHWNEILPDLVGLEASEASG